MPNRRLKRKAIPVPNSSDDEKVIISKSTEDETGTEETSEMFETISKNLFVPLAKAVKDEQIIVGIGLVPDVADAHGDVIKASVIKKAAHGFLASYNKTVKLGVQHKNFKPKFELLESYIAPITFVLGSRTIKEGSWVVAVKVLDATVWAQIKKGYLTGFSIGGVATTKKIKADK